jgi:hypothetical protein
MKHYTSNYFLEVLATRVLNQYGQDLSSLNIIFPNQRSAVLFTNYLSRKAGKTIWSPKLFSISTFIQNCSSLIIPDRLTLLSELHQCWEQISDQKESFGKFYFWGELILKDFNEIDRWMGNADLLFKSLKDQKEIEEFFGGMDDNELSALKSFWNSIHSENSNEKSSFTYFWELLGQLYQVYKTTLLSKNLAYEGLLYREVAEKDIPYSEIPESYIFAGFNLLSTSEEYIIKKYIQERNAVSHWDIDFWYLNQPEQEAGKFLRKYKEDVIFNPHFQPIIPSRIDSAKKIYQIPLPSKTEQCMATGKLIEQLIEEEGIPEEEIALILPAEDLLFPLLNALPKAVKKINITMGYPLKHTPWFSLVEYLIQFQENISDSKEKEFWHLPVLGLLRHPLISDETSLKLAESLKDINRIRISLDDLSLLFDSPQAELWKLIFYPCSEKEFPQHLLNIIQWLAEHFETEKNFYDINQDFSYQLYTQINRLNDLIQAESSDVENAGWYPLYSQVLSQVKLPFSGEPLEGLQIMGVLESRNLDYQKVIILSMEEGSFPPAPDGSSFIPHNLRKAFGLPLPDVQDASYAYYFYRLLHQATELYLFYTPGSEGLKGGEKSRYILQLENELPSLITETIQIRSSVESKIHTPPTIRYSDHPELIESLRTVFEKGISPSAINQLLDCKLKFAYKYLLKLAEPVQISEEIDPAQIGSILHKAMELLYQNLPKDKSGKILVNAERLESIRPKIEFCIAGAFKSEVFNGKAPKWEGRNLIIRSVLEKYINGILDIDKNNSPFIILETEKRVQSKLTINAPLLSTKPIELTIHGYIDRVDKTEFGIRILDYKTGRDSREFTNISDLTNSDSTKRNKAALQTLLYGWMWIQSNPNYLTDAQTICSGLYLMKELYTSPFDYRLIHKPDGYKKMALEDIRPVLSELEHSVRELLSALGNSTYLFEATEDIKKCEYCAYKSICGR